MCCITFNLAECSIRVTILLEPISHWIHAVGFHSLAFAQICLYYCKVFLWWLLQLNTDFQFITLHGCDITGRIFIHKFDHVILTPVEFCVISPWSFSRFLSNYKKAHLQWLLHMHAKFQPVHSSSLPCRRDRPLIFFTQKISHNFIRFQPKLVKRCT